MPVRSDPPPTHTLQAFSVVARLKSFSRAASEIGITQSAVSQRIGALETQLNVRLLRRDVGQVELTVEGAAYLETVDAVLHALRHASARLLERRETVRISVLPSFARCWLSPRLPSLAALLPEVEVALHVSDDKVSMDNGNFDIAIRLIPFADRSGEPMTRDDESLVAVVAPKHLKGTSNQSDVFAACTLLADDCSRLGQPAWDSWRSWHQLNHFDYRGARGITFNDAGLMVEAATSGVGVALARESLVTDSIKAGTLTPIGVSLPCPGRTVLLERPRGRRARATHRVARWFIESAHKA